MIQTKSTTIALREMHIRQRAINLAQLLLWLGVRHTEPSETGEWFDGYVERWITR